MMILLFPMLNGSAAIAPIFGMTSNAGMERIGANMDNREQRAINKAKENPAVFLFFLRMDKQALAAVRARVAVLSAAGYKDFHTATAAAAFEVKPEDVTKDQRAAAKAFNFWDLYSMGNNPQSIASVVLGNRAPSRFAENYGMGKRALLQAMNVPVRSVHDAKRVLET